MYNSTTTESPTRMGDWMKFYPQNNKKPKGMYDD